MAKARVLVIDDEESPRESMRFILKDRYDVNPDGEWSQRLGSVEQERAV